MKPAPLKQRFSNRTLVWLCVAALLLSLLPLYTLSFYNHASYGDLGVSVLTHGVWRDSESWPAILRAAMQNTLGTLHGGDGAYAATFLGSLHPAVGGENLYWLTTLILLSFFLLSLSFFLRQALMRVLGADKPTYWTAYCCVAFAMIQFVPELSEAFFWFNGGVAYTLMWSAMVLRLGVWICLIYCRKRGAKLALAAALVLLTVIVGGAKSTTLLFALLVEMLLMLWAFGGRRTYRWFVLGVFGLMITCSGVSAFTASGSFGAFGLSQGVSASKALAQSFALGFRLMGNWFSLPLMVVWALVAWQLSEAIHGCPFRFSHPVWITVLSVCLFCAQIIPMVCSGELIGEGRTLNTFFFTFVLMGCVLTMYWMGWLARRREQRSRFPAIGTSRTERVKGIALALAVILGIVGCVTYRPDKGSERGVQNMASVSALRSLLSGEAQAYDRAMDERDAAFNDPAQQEVVLRAVEEIPDAFMGDVLESDQLDTLLRLYSEYYKKQQVSVSGEDAEN